MNKQAKPDPAGPVRIVRNANSGQFVTVRGAGVLRGRLPLKQGIDLTKPIASQALKDGVSAKRV